MKIMTYNIYRGGEERLPLIQQIIESEQPDVLAIQEACHWMESGRFDAIGDLLNIPSSQRIYSRSHPRSASGRIYDLALYSRFPVVTSKVFHDPETVWHSLLHVTLDHPFLKNVIVVHLSPKDEDWRMKEVNRLTELLHTAKTQGCLLLGDLNALSPYDQYPSSLAAELQERGIVKFGNPSRFDMIQKLLDAGWVDGLNLEQKAIPLQMTVREGSEDKDHLNLRLDYIFVNRPLVSRIQKLSILDTEMSRKASDHFPVIMEMA